MGIEALQSAIPDYAKDLRLNLSVLSTSSLDPVSAWGSAYAAALVSKNSTVKQAILEEAREHLSDEQIEGCRSAAAVMGMTNVWYKFSDLMVDAEVKALPPKLRMNVLVSHAGVGPVLFETFSLSASIVNACGTCVKAHTAQLRKLDVPAQGIADVGRIASIVKAVADALTFEE